MALLAAFVQPPLAQADPGPIVANLNLENPSEGINDPAAAMPILDRNCLAGQVDVNTADGDQIGAAFGINSRPVLDRIVKARNANEFLKATDLVSIPGVGPNKYTILATYGCAPPRALPPTPVTFCKAGSTAIDLQTAPVQDVASIMPRKVAERLVAARPLSDILNQVSTPRVEGLNTPLIDRIVRQGKVCITPAPFTYRGKTWRWVSRDGGAVVSASEDNRYTLYVPPARLTDDGAWATVEITTPSDGLFPSADFHIHGTWTGWVAGQLPLTEGVAFEQQVWMHDAADGPRVSSGDGVAAGPNGTMVAGLQSLSANEVLPLPTYANNQCSGQAGAFVGSPKAPLLCNLGNSYDSPLATVLKPWTTAQAEMQARYGNNAPAGDCRPSHARVVQTGTMYVPCKDVTVMGSVAQFDWENDTDSAFWFGNVYEFSKSGPGEVGRTVTSGGWLTASIFNALNAKTHAIPPSTSMLVTVRQGEPATDVTMKSSGWFYLYVTLSQITALVDVLPVAGGQSCVIGAGLDVGGDMNDAVKGLTSCVVGVAKDIAESGTSVASKSAAKWLGHVGWIMIATDLAVSTAINLSQYSPRTASHVFLAPPPPLTDGAGGSLLATAPGGGDGRYIARLAGSRQSWLVLPPDSQFDFWHAEEIASADTWNCWAEGLFLMDDVDSYIKTEMEIGSDGVPVPVNKQYLNLPGDPVVVEQPPIPQSWEAGTCNRATLAKWNFASVAQGGNVPSGVILKEPEWISRSTYYVKPDGQLVNIAEGGTYLCLAAKVPVIANFTRSHIDQWQPQDLTEKAVCP